jgi:hypothetical protein
MSFSQQQTLAMLRAANASSPHTVLQAAIDIERSDPVEGPKSAARLLRLLHGIVLDVLGSAFGNQPSEPERDLRGLIESILHLARPTTIANSPTVRPRYLKRSA